MGRYSTPEHPARAGEEEGGSIVSNWLFLELSPASGGQKPARETAVSLPDKQWAGVFPRLVRLLLKALQTVVGTTAAILVARSVVDGGQTDLV